MKRSGSDFARLVEHAFPLKQASLDAVYEKNIRHGHISALHIWPARRPLAACRAALLATLLPDPGVAAKRKELSEQIGGEVVNAIERKRMPSGQIVERVKEETQGGVLHWGRETTNSDVLTSLREDIQSRHGDAPRVLDPFAGGGALPLEAMRLGCAVTAIDINPVAWFVLKCTLQYPRQLSGQKRLFPDFVLEDDEFLELFYKANPHSVGKGKATRKQKETLFAAHDVSRAPAADVAWHVRAWGRRVLARVRRDIAAKYPVYADFEPLKRDHISYERRPMEQVSLDSDGFPAIETLNREFSKQYLDDLRNPRWVAKPAIAYLWARTVKCKNCRATLPLLKTLWLARTNAQRIILEVQPNASADGVEFTIRENVPRSGGNNAQRREHDKRLGAGTMSRSGAKCPCCPAIMTLEDIQLEGQAGRMGRTMTAVAVAGQRLKEFRLPTALERQTGIGTDGEVAAAFERIPFGLPTERIVEDAKRNTWCVQYGIDSFAKLFTERQLIALASLVKHTREMKSELRALEYPQEWTEAICSYVVCSISRLTDFLNCGAQWKLDRATINHLFVRYALPISWDFAEGNVLADLPGGYDICLRKIAVSIDTLFRWRLQAPPPTILRASSATGIPGGAVDLVITDPPYYNAIGYAVLMDYFYVWLRRALHGLSKEHDEAFATPLTPKWDSAADDGELVDDASRHDGDAARSKAAYERGMERVFRRSREVLSDTGRLVVVFAHKDPAAWDSLVSAIIRAGFVVDASWPIQTEQSSRMRALSSAALASSVWLVCRPRRADVRPGWDNQVLAEMRANIGQRLREYWDAGIRGPDFVWAATGPALEAYSKHPAVRKADERGQLLTVGEFLVQVRRMVVDYVVGQVLSGGAMAASDFAAADRLDEVTAYYLLHRNDFGFADAPVGTCILYAVSCGLSDTDLIQTWDLLAKGKEKTREDEDDGSAESEDGSDDEAEVEESGSTMRLKTWDQRKSKSLGYDAPNGRPVPLVDRIHRLMHLWRGGDVHKVDDYIDENGLRRQELFKRVVQSLIELSPRGGDERALLESLSNHIGAKGPKAESAQMEIGFGAHTAGTFSDTH
jgi:adenine-specific DNA methylase